MSELHPFIANSIKQSGSLVNEQSPWLSQFRKVSAEQLLNCDFPNRKHEHFKYNNLTALTKHTFELIDSNTLSKTALFETFNELNPATLVFIDGQLQSTEGCSITVTPIADLNDSQKQTALDLLRQDRKNLVTEVRNSLLSSGFWLELTGDEMVHVVHYFTEAHQFKSSANLCLFNLASNQKATVIEHFVTEEKQSVQSLQYQSSLFSIGNNAELTHYRLQLESDQAIHFGSVKFHLNRDSRCESFHIGLGGELKKIDIDAIHNDSGSHLSLNGIYLAKGHQQIDYHTNVEHTAPHCTSSEVFRGIVDEKAKAVFNGRIHIHKYAQKTLAELSNKNLLLSTGCEINTKPELEIYADDVRCAHGATVSQMDKKALFYLQSRGIEKSKAERMISFGFINELIEQLKHQPVSEYLKPVLGQLFERAQ